ncbi:MAG: hypothetical protein K2G85_10005 [Muribaculaceae bacterium]|nr:hypothetical protein [Muribaculaceae bacterium]
MRYIYALRNIYVVICIIFAMVIAGCASEKKKKDRREADDMFRKISAFVSEYIEKVGASPDSASWATACSDFEEGLDKITFSYSPDTDILLTEGQNDTINALIEEYIKARDSRIHEIMHPIVLADSISDSLNLTEAEQIDINQADASHNPGN